MSRPRQFAVLLCATLALAGCGRSGSYRYKLTLSVDTPDGVKTASSVIEVAIREVTFLEHGFPVTLTGEALYLDLGAGRQPLLVLLRDPCAGYDCSKLSKDERKYWWGNGPTRLLAQLYGDPVKTDEQMFDEFAALATPRNPVELEPRDLPVLATFENTNDPNSIRRVDPNNIAATLGPGIRWRKITIETTNAHITIGIEKKLPWLATLSSAEQLDGRFLRHPEWRPDYTFANSLQTYDFKRD